MKKILMKRLILIVILLILGVSIFYLLRVYYYSHWQFIYYGKSENFEVEVLAVPARIERNTMKAFRELGADTKMYYKQIWLKCKKPDEIKICSIYIKSNVEEEGPGRLKSEDLCRTLTRLSENDVYALIKDLKIQIGFL